MTKEELKELLIPPGLRDAKIPEDLDEIMSDLIYASGLSPTARSLVREYKPVAYDYLDREVLEAYCEAASASWSPQASFVVDSEPSPPSFDDIFDIFWEGIIGLVAGIYQASLYKDLLSTKEMFQREYQRLPYDEPGGTDDLWNEFLGSLEDEEMQSLWEFVEYNGGDLTSILACVLEFYGMCYISRDREMSGVSVQGARFVAEVETMENAPQIFLKEGPSMQNVQKIYSMQFDGGADPRYLLRA